MKAKKMFVLVLVFVLTSLLLVNTAFAAWYLCTVTRVGAGPGGHIVYLTDTKATPTFTDRWFLLNPDVGKELLAVALTAYANDKKFYVSLASTVAGSQISVGYVKN